MTACQGLGGTGTKYTYAQLEGLWINAGGPKAQAPVAAAIALAESGGCSSALNPNDNNGTQSSFGLWQISTGTHAAPSPSWANGATNAQLANWKVVHCYNQRGKAEHRIKEGKQAVKMTRLSCHRFRSNQVRMCLSTLACNRGNLRHART